MFFCILIPVLILGYFTKLKWELFGFLFGTYYLTPDLDIDGSEPDRNWGIFENFWNLYSRLFSHRGWSHNLLIGTLTRLLTLTLIILWCYILFILFVYETIDIYKHLIIFIEFINNNLDKIFKVSIGIFLSDMVHIVSDLLYSSYKQNRLRLKLKYVLILGIIVFIIWSLSGL